LPCPGGDGAIHSRLFAPHGLRPTGVPKNMLFTKLKAKMICVATMPIAQTVMNWFIGNSCRNVS